METGDLSTTPFPQILHNLYVSAQSGILKVDNGEIEKTVHIMMGKPIFASSNDPHDRMGALLVRRGIITEEQLEESLKETHQRLGTILVEKGYLEPEQLVTAVVDQAEEIIYSLFEWDKGSYSFEPGDPLTEEVITLDLSTASIIFWGVKNRYSAQMLENVVGPLDRVLKKNPDSSYVSQELSLSQEEEVILNASEEGKTVEELISIGKGLGLSKTEVLQFLCSLLFTMTLQVTEKAPAVAEKAPTAKEQPVSAPAGTDDVRAEILKKYKEFPRMTLFEKMGLTRKATKGDILLAYNKLQKRLKPEKLGPEYNDIKEKTRNVFSQIQEAYAILYRDETRSKYEQETEKKASSGLLSEQEAEFLQEVPDENPSRRAFKRAKAFFQEKKFSEALDSFGEAIGLDPEVGEYYTGLGLLHTKEFPGHEPDMDRAEECFEKAVSLEPLNWRNFYYLGVICKSRKEWDKAEEFFRKVIEINPKHEEARRQIESISQAKD